MNEEKINTEKILDASVEMLSRYESRETETVALGCLLLGKTFDWNPFDLTVDDFTTVVGRDVFTFICSYFKENGNNPDLVLTWEHFKAEGKKYHAQLCGMIDVAVTPSMYSAYCTELRKMTVKRKTMAAFFDWQGGRLSFFDYQEKIKGLELGGKPVISWGNMLQDFQNGLDNPLLKPKIYQTPFEEFNIKTGGVLGNEIVIVAGRPGKGKTGMLCNIAIDSAKRGYSVAFLSLEMDSFSILSRFFGSELNINTMAFRLSKLLNHEKTAVAQKILDWADYKIFVEDRRISHLQDVERIIRDNKPEVVIIDYIQLLYSGRRGDNRNQELDFIINRLKTIARKQRCVIYAGCQLGRQAEDPNGDKNASIADLRDSGSLEQTADMVWIINPRPGNDKKDTATVLLDIAKSRGTVKFRMTLEYVKTFQRFNEIQEGK